MPCNSFPAEVSCLIRTLVWSTQYPLSFPGSASLGEICSSRLISAFSSTEWQIYPKNQILFPLRSSESATKKKSSRILCSFSLHGAKCSPVMPGSLQVTAPSSVILSWKAEDMKVHFPKSMRWIFPSLVWGSPSKIGQWLSVADEGGTETRKKLRGLASTTISCFTCSHYTWWLHFCLGVPSRS